MAKYRGPAAAAARVGRGIPLGQRGQVPGMEERISRVPGLGAKTLACDLFCSGHVQHGQRANTDGVTSSPAAWVHGRVLYLSGPQPVYHSGVLRP